MECIFCQIVDKKIPAKIIGENHGAIAFLDIQPFSDGHTVVIPKKHVQNLSQCDSQTLHDVIDLVKQVAHDIQNSSLKP
jgi:histidine triad (HIT) family protein